MIDEVLDPLEPLGAVDSVKAIVEVRKDNGDDPHGQHQDHADFYIDLSNLLEEGRNYEEYATENDDDAEDYFQHLIVQSSEEIVSTLTQNPLDADTEEKDANKKPENKVAIEVYIL